MKTLILILFTYCASSQIKSFQISDDAKHVHAAAIITSGVSSLCFEFHLSPAFSLGIGGVFGIGITYAKERWWDGKMGMGVRSTRDEHSGIYGTGCGLIVGTYYIAESNRREIEKYKYE